jgi:hypothetical protein
MLRYAALVKTDVSEEHIASIPRVSICELGTTFAVISTRSILRRIVRISSITNTSSQRASVAIYY